MSKFATRSRAVSFEKLFRKMAGQGGETLKTRIAKSPAKRPDYTAGPTVVDPSRLPEGTLAKPEYFFYRRAFGDYTTDYDERDF